MSTTYFEPEGSSSGRRLYIQIWFGNFMCISINSLTDAYTGACKTYLTITAYTTVFLKMNSWSCKEKPTWCTTYTIVYFVSLYVFRAYLGSSSRGTTVWIRLLVLFRWLSIFLVGWELFESNQDNWQSSKKNNMYQLLYTYGCPSWWWP